MRNCKLFLLLLLFLFVFTACQSAEQPTPIPEEPAPIVKEPEPVPEEPAPIVEEPEPIPLPDPAAIEAKTRQASICPCLAVEHAQWNLARHGFSDYTGEPLNSVLAAFSAHVTENWDSLTQTYGDLLNGTLWIIDHDENGYYLQIIRFTDTAEQLLMLQWDGTNVSVFQESTLLDGFVPAVCASEDIAQRAREAPDHTMEDPYFFRIAATDAKQYVRTKFARSSEDSNSVLAQTLSEEFCRINDSIYAPPEEEPLSSFGAWILQFDFSPLAYGDDPVGKNEVLLRDYLLRAFTKRTQWDAPFAVYPDYEGFYELRWMLKMLEEEMSRDSEFADYLMSLDRWEVSGIGAYHHALTGYENEIAVVTLTSSPAGIDSREILTPSRKRVQQLAENGSGSQLIPAEVKADFVNHVMSVSQNGDQLSGRNKPTKWRWSIQGNGIYTVKIEAAVEDRAENALDFSTVLSWSNGVIEPY